MKNPSNDRDKLSALLESFGIDRDGFNNLRPDSYERTLYSQPDGVALLGQFYSVLCGSGTLEEQASKCPPWPMGSPRPGEQPSISILSRIWSRIGKDQLLAEVDPIAEALEKFAVKVKASPLGKDEIVLQAMIGVLVETLMKDRLEKKRPDPAIVSALQTNRKMKQNDEVLKQSDRRIRILEDNQAAAKAKLEAVLGNAKSKGGLTSETLRQIEEAANLL